jgi:hypothetical protein
MPRDDGRALRRTALSERAETAAAERHRHHQEEGDEQPEWAGGAEHNNHVINRHCRDQTGAWGSDRSRSGLHPSSMGLWREVQAGAPVAITPRLPVGLRLGGVRAGRRCALPRRPRRRGRGDGRANRLSGAVRRAACATNETLLADGARAHHDVSLFALTSTSSSSSSSSGSSKSSGSSFSSSSGTIAPSILTSGTGSSSIGFSASNGSSNNTAG